MRPGKAVDMRYGASFRRGGIPVDTISSMEEVYRALSEENKNKGLIRLLNLYKTSTSFMFKTPDKERIVEGYIEYFKYLASELPIEKLITWLNISEQYEQAGMLPIGKQVNLSTMHGAKGKEWEHVILFADDTKVFPSFDDINRLYNKHTPEADIYRSIDEDRRLHYVAMTRARKVLTIFTERNNVGTYTLEALGVIPHLKGDENDKLSLKMALKPELVGPKTLMNIWNSLFHPSSEYYHETPVIADGDTNSITNEAITKQEHTPEPISTDQEILLGENSGVAIVMGGDDEEEEEDTWGDDMVGANGAPASSAFSMFKGISTPLTVQTTKETQSNSSSPQSNPSKNPFSAQIGGMGAFLSLDDDGDDEEDMW